MHAPCHIVVCDLSVSTIFYHTISQTAQFSERNKLWRIKWVLWFSLLLLSETFLILRRIQQIIIINVHWFRVKYTLFLSECNQNFENRLVAFLPACLPARPPACLPVCLHVRMEQVGRHWRDFFIEIDMSIFRNFDYILTRIMCTLHESNAYLW